MFKILPVQSTEEQKEYALGCGTQYCPGYFAYVMKDFETEALMGFSQFELLGQTGTIRDIKCVDGLDDFEAMFILGRQTLNFMEKCGVKTAYADKDSAELTLLKAIGFKLGSDDRYEMNIEGLFDGHCHNH